MKWEHCKTSWVVDHEEDFTYDPDLPSTENADEWEMVSAIFVQTPHEDKVVCFWKRPLKA
jgi:hypothetical protein